MYLCIYVARFIRLHVKNMDDKSFETTVKNEFYIKYFFLYLKTQRFLQYSLTLIKMLILHFIVNAFRLLIFNVSLLNMKYFYKCRFTYIYISLSSFI